MSDIPLACMTLRGRVSQEVLNLHETYGDIVRIAPNDLSYLSASAWQDIMGHRKRGQAEMEKDPEFFTIAEFNGQQGVDIVLSGREDHQRLRRILSHAFSENSMREQEPLIRHYVDLLIEQLKANCDGGRSSLNMVSWLNWSTFDVIGDLAFGEPFGCLQGSSYHPWISMLFDDIKANVFFRFARRFPILQRLLMIMTPQSLIRAKNSHAEMTMAKVSKRLAMETHRPDFIKFMKDAKMGMSLPEIYANAAVLVIAGSETTATALSGAIYHLLQNPAALQKLTAEIRSTFKSDKEINFTSVNNLKYMLACIEETLRIYPPLPALVPRVVPKGGTEISGKWVPGGTAVGVYHWAMYRSPLHFTDPNSFHPERFLGDPRFESDNKAALQPFHVGPRACIGRNLAMAEIRIILARIIFNFDMKLAPECKHWAEDQEMFILWQKPDLNVHLTPVQRSCI